MTQTVNNQAAPVQSAQMTVVSPDVAAESYRKGLEPFDMKGAFELAEVLARTGYCGVGSAEEALARLMFGRELGLTAMNSLRAVYIVNGRPGLDANVMYALCLQFKECEYFEPVESTPKIATFRAKRRGRPEFVLSWTIEQAITAGLVGGAKDKDNWKNYPENMLRARCISNMARMLFPEPINGMHTIDEIETSTMATPTVTMVSSSAVAPAPGAVKEGINESDKIEEGFLARIAALPATPSTPEQKAEKAAVRAEIAKAKDMNTLSGPWYKRVVDAYTAKFPVKKSAGAPAVTQQPGGAVAGPAVAKAAPAAPPPAAPAPAPVAAAPVAAPAPVAAEPSDEEDLGGEDRGDDPNSY